MVDEPEFARWMEEGRRALRSARVQVGEGLHSWACFAAEQSAQLALKALLHGLGLGPWGHDLVEVGNRAREAVGAFPPEVEESLLRLSRHYIPARYPDAHPSGHPGAHYGHSDAEQATEDAERIMRDVEAAWEAVLGAHDDGGR